MPPASALARCKTTTTQRVEIPVGSMLGHTKPEVSLAQDCFDGQAAVEARQGRVNVSKRATFQNIRKRGCVTIGDQKGHDQTLRLNLDSHTRSTKLCSGCLRLQGPRSAKTKPLSMLVARVEPGPSQAKPTQPSPKPVQRPRGKAGSRALGGKRLTLTFQIFMLFQVLVKDKL